MWEMIGVSIAFVSVSVLAMALLAKVIYVAVYKWKASRRRRTEDRPGSKPAPPRKHIMTKAERDVMRAVNNAQKEN
jgi:hypothetical protein